MTQHRICLIGSLSVGKTTLFNLLKAEEIFRDYEFLEESARATIEYLNRHPTTMTMPERQDFQVMILERQIQNETGIGKKSFISDRGVIDGLSYMHDFPNIAEFRDLIAAYLSQNPYTHIFYLPAEFGFDSSDRGLEDTEFQLKIDQFLRKNLEHLGVSFIELCGSSEERKEQILNIIGK